MIYVRAWMHTAAPDAGKSLFNARFGGNEKRIRHSCSIWRNWPSVWLGTTCERAKPTLYFSAGEGMCSFGIVAKKTFFTSLIYGRFVKSLALTRCGLYRIRRFRSVFGSTMPIAHEESQLRVTCSAN